MEDTILLEDLPVFPRFNNWSKNISMGRTLYWPGSSSKSSIWIFSIPPWNLFKWWWKMLICKRKMLMKLCLSEDLPIFQWFKNWSKRISSPPLVLKGTIYCLFRLDEMTSETLQNLPYSLEYENPKLFMLFFGKLSTNYLDFFVSLLFLIWKNSTVENTVTL